MFLEPSQEKNKILGIRLNEASLQEFNKFCKERKLSKSEVARTAITQYIILNYNEETNPKLIFSKSQFKYMISCLDEGQIDELVKISLQNGTYDMKSIEKIIMKEDYLDPTKTEVAFQIKTLHRFIFSKEGQSWFESFSSSWQENKLVIEGEHKLGSNFTSYIQKLLSQYFAMHNFNLHYAQSSIEYKEKEYNYLLKCEYIPKNDTK